MYMYNWFTLLYIWNKHNIVNQLYFNKNFKRQASFLKKQEKSWYFSDKNILLLDGSS